MVNRDELIDAHLAIADMTTPDLLAQVLGVSINAAVKIAARRGLVSYPLPEGRCYYTNRDFRGEQGIIRAFGALHYHMARGTQPLGAKAFEKLCPALVADGLPSPKNYFLTPADFCYLIVHHGGSAYNLCRKLGRHHIARSKVEGWQEEFPRGRFLQVVAVGTEGFKTTLETELRNKRKQFFGLLTPPRISVEIVPQLTLFFGETRRARKPQ